MPNPVTPTPTPIPEADAPLTPGARFPLDYKKHDDDIRHYSTTRSALTSFLMTVGLTLLANYFNSGYPNGAWFFCATGGAVLIAAIFVCRVFSYRTERSSLHLEALWKWSKGELTTYPNIKNSPSKEEIRKAMRADEMNTALYVVVGIIVVVFAACAWFTRNVPASAVADLVAKSAANSSKAVIETNQSAQAALRSAQDAARSAQEAARFAGESVKSADAASKASRDSADVAAKLSAKPSPKSRKNSRHRHTSPKTRS